MSIQKMLKKLFGEGLRAKTITIMGLFIPLALIISGFLYSSANAFNDLVIVRAGILGKFLDGFKNMGATAIVYLLLCIISFFLYRSKALDPGENELGYEYADSLEHGSAKLLKEDEIEDILRVSTIEKTDKNILGSTSDGKRVYTYEPSKTPALKKLPVMDQHFLSNEHKVVMATSGKGKSFSVAMPDVFQAIRRGESYIVTDPKGDLYSSTAKIAEEHGYIVKILNLKAPECSDGCNYLSFIGSNPDKAQTLANTIINNTVADSKKRNQWDDVAEYLLKALLLYFTYGKEFDPLTQNMGNVYDLIQRGADEIEEILNALPDTHPAKTAAYTFFSTSDNYKNNAIFSLVLKLGVFDNQSIRDMTTYTDLDFVEPGLTKCAYYIATSDQESSKDFFAAMYFACAFQSLVDYADRQDSRKLPVKVNMILDEFPNVAQITDYDKKLNTIRSRGICLTMIFQDLGQLKDRYPGNLYSTIMSACNIKIFLGGDDVDVTLPYLEKLMGNTTISTDKTTIPHHKLVPGLDNLQPVEKVSVSNIKRGLLDTHDLRTMKNSEQIVILSNKEPFKTRKYDLRNHPFYDESKHTNQYKHVPQYKQKEDFLELSNRAKSIRSETIAEKNSEERNLEREKKKEIKMRRKALNDDKVIKEIEDEQLREAEKKAALSKDDRAFTVNDNVSNF
ncbi:type IV secretion system protein VirD4 [Lachnospiraceae bacterium PF1-22]